MKILPSGLAVVESDSHLSRWIEEAGTLAVADKFLRQFAQYIPKGGVACDVGACLGDHTATYLSMVGPDGTVHAFEPNPEAYQCLAHNMAQHHNVCLYPIGLGGCTMQARVVPSPNLGACQLVPTDTGRIVIERLDEIAGPWTRLDWLKLDCEGFECDVLAGAEATIRRLRPTMLIEVNRGILESRGRSAEGLVGQIQALGYAVQPAESVWSMDAEQVDVLCLAL